MPLYFSVSVEPVVNSTLSTMNTTSDINVTSDTPTTDIPAVISINFIVTYCFFSPFLCVLGIFGNVLTLVIVRDQKKKNSSSFLVFSLAVCDTVVLASRLLFVIYRNCQMFAPSENSFFFKIHTIV